MAPEVAFSVYCNPRGRSYLEQQGWVGARLVTHPLLGIRGVKAVSELSLLGYLAGREVDLLHSLAMTAPLHTRAANVVTLADVTWMISPDSDELWTARLWKMVVPPVARRADRVIVHSEAAKDHVVEYLGVRRELIDVIPHGGGLRTS